jgi:hypothetical protein
MPLSELHFRSESVVYSRKLGLHDEVTAALSLYQSGLAGSSGVHPAFQVSYRHPVKSLPIPLLLKHHGTISGHVFYDPTSSSRYSQSMYGVDGAEVWLDGERKTVANAHGYYAFSGVPFGDHRVEVKISSSEPYYFTTNSPTTAAANGVADFVRNFVQCQIFGYLRNESGAPIPNIVVLLKGEGRSEQVLSGGDGSFQFRGLVSGRYAVGTDAASYPPGYNLQDVDEKMFELEPGVPAHTEFRVQALRSITGVVTVYDTTLLKPVPVAGAVVRILGRGIEARTDETGRYILRRVSPGELTVTAEKQGSSRSQKVEVPQQPGEVRDINFMLQ